MHHTPSRPSRPWSEPLRSLVGWRGALALALLVGTPLVFPGPVGAQVQEDLAARTILVPVNGTVRLKMATGRPIKTVSNPKENVLEIRTVLGDPTTVLLIGQQPDVTRVEMVDVDEKREVYEVIVQPDVEYLRRQLQRALPQGNITPIPISQTAVVLDGHLNRPEDAAVASGVAQAAGFQAINALRVGGVQQVQLDVVIASVSRTEFRRMAFNFLNNAENYFLASTVGQAAFTPQQVGTGLANLGNGGGIAGIPGAPNGSNTNVLFGVLHEGWGFLGFLQALRDESILKIMAEPRVTTMSGQPASFLVGGEQAIPVPAGLGQVGVQFEEFGTRLNFLPVVLGNGKIHLEVEPEISNLDPAAGTSISGTVVPGRVTQRVHTTVELESGQTFVIGGLIQHAVIANASKVPILGELPYVSALFSSKSFQEVEQEVVILVTPYLVDAQSCGQRAKVLPGQETRSPDDFELFLESILEAPRGARTINHGRGYVPAYKNSPSLTVYPCAGGQGGCATQGCSTEACGPVCPPLGPVSEGHVGISASPAEEPPIGTGGPPESLPPPPEAPVTPSGHVMPPRMFGTTTPEPVGMELDSRLAPARRDGQPSWGEGSGMERPHRAQPVSLPPLPGPGMGSR